ncbi:hypothetical protein PV433_13825 [Paenibacillus sp. GYB004]|uniref:hypothetical protein n=1 Tax=Paenibacillus sp. GYB004 TaxID=2994393 RepID=UPI002F967098
MDIDSHEELVLFLNLCAVEKRRAIRMYADQRDDSLYQTLLSASVITECRLAQIGRSAKVLFIGAGAFPISTCTLHADLSGVWDVEPVAGNNCIYDTLILKAPQPAVASPTC